MSIIQYGTSLCVQCGVLRFLRNANHIVKVSVSPMELSKIPTYSTDGTYYSRTPSILRVPPLNLLSRIRSTLRDHLRLRAESQGRWSIIQESRTVNFRLAVQLQRESSLDFDCASFTHLIHYLVQPATADREHPAKPSTSARGSADVHQYCKFILIAVQFPL